MDENANTLNLKLIYFKGCPNVEQAKELIVSTGFDFVEICQDNLEANDRFKLFASPTLILNDEHIIFGSKVGSGGGCSIGLPDSQEVLRRITENY